MRAERQRSSRRAQVLESALRIFGEKGYHDTSVNDIITRAGIARGTFYLYFENKRAIFEELLEGYLARIWGAVRRIQLAPDAPSPVDQIEQNVRRVVAVLTSNPELNHLLLRHAVGLDADFDRKLSEFYGRLLQQINGALALGQQMGVVRPGDTQVQAACVLGSIKEVTDRTLVAQGPQHLDREAVVQAILEYNLYGLFLAR